MSKRVRDKGTSSKGSQATTSMDVSRLLQTQEHRDNFQRNYINRAIVPPKYGDLSTFYSFTFPTVFGRHGLEDFIEDKGFYYPTLVRAFYASLEKKKDHLLACVKGVKIKLTVDKISQILGLSKEGTHLTQSSPSPLNGYSRFDVYYSMCRFTEAEIAAWKQENVQSGSKTILNTGYMTVDNRLLHYFIVYVLAPKASNYAQAQDFDLQIMHALLTNQPLNWSSIILDHMFRQTTRSGALIYARVISRILEHFGVNFTNEYSIEMTEGSNEVNLHSLKHMAIVLDDTTDTYIQKPHQPPPAPMVIPDISTRPSTSAPGSSSSQVPNVDASGSEVTLPMLWNFMHQMQLDMNDRCNRIHSDMTAGVDNIREDMRLGFAAMNTRMDSFESLYRGGPSQARDDGVDDDGGHMHDD